MATRRFSYWMYRSHAWAGLFSGLFLIFICVTGSLAVFKPELEQALDWNNRATLALPIAPAAVEPERAIAIAEQSVERGRALTLRLPNAGTLYGHGDAYRVELAADRDAGRPILHVLVDRQTGAVIGSAAYTQTWSYWIRQLHVRFLYGQWWGRWIVGFFGIVLLFATVSGAWIYLRFNGNRWTPKLRRGRGQRVLLADLHKIVGVGSLAFNAMFGLTGAVLGLEPAYESMMKWRIFQPDRPTAVAARPASLPPMTVASSANVTPTTRTVRAPRRPAVQTLADGTIDRAIAEAISLVPGSVVNSVSLTNRSAGTIRVSVDVPAGHLIREGASGVLFDARTLEPISVVDARHAGGASRLYGAVEPLHFGRLGGLMVVKLIWAAMGLSAALLSISGFAIYLLRHRKRRPTPSPALVA